MSRKVCLDSEDIVRAACGPTHYDGERISPSLFATKNGGVSVSRLQVLTLDEHWEVLGRKLVSPPQRLELIVEINIALLQRLGKEYTDGSGKSARVDLTVVEAPEAWNPAHAEIVEPITRGLANRILNHVVRHKR